MTSPTPPTTKLSTESEAAESEAHKGPASDSAVTTTLTEEQAKPSDITESAPDADAVVLSAPAVDPTASASHEAEEQQPALEVADAGSSEETDTAEESNADHSTKGVADDQPNGSSEPPAAADACGDDAPFDDVAEVAEVAEDAEVAEVAKVAKVAKDDVPGDEVPSAEVTEDNVAGDDSSDGKAEQPIEETSEKDKLSKAAGGTSYKDLPTLLSLQKRLERLQTSMTAELQTEENSESTPPEESQLSADLELQKLSDRLSQLIMQHHAWQKKLIDDIDESITSIGVQIAEGHVSEAQRMWDKSHNALKRINDIEVQEKFQTQLAPLKADLTKLLDWKKFAASEKKKEMIENMRALIHDETAPPQKAKKIRGLQEDWKTLGHSDDNDELWNQFSEVARQAFEPCKVYFKERKEKQASNLIARNNICEQLEAYSSTIQEGQINLTEVSKLENQARDDWKKYAPVAQAKIKSLQKRYNDVLNNLRHKKRSALHAHNAQKQELIKQAHALVELEDLQSAINQAKTLQLDWKNLGPGSFKDDRKLWSDFREACDALFAKRDAATKENKQQVRQASSAARDTLNNISSLLSLSDEEFSESRGHFNALAETFKKALTPDLKVERKALQDQFSNLSKRYDARMRATPDKKSLQLMQQVQSKADFCQRYENNLLDGDTLPEAQVLDAEWETLATISNTDIEQAMKKRYKLLIQHLDKAEEWKTLTDKQDMRGRELCVEAEIMAGLDTPATDKAIRMQQQLNQLQRGLGRQPLSQKEKLQKLLETDMKFLCLGPLNPVNRSTLANRLQQIRQKL